MAGIVGILEEVRPTEVEKMLILCYPNENQILSGRSEK